MPTRDRPAFVLQSIHYFQRQDYPNRELIIMDDGLSDLAHLLPDDSRIRYQRLSPGQSIGGKRNRACELARGSIIAQWDDDDWYAPGRLGAQVAPLLCGEADISALPTGHFFDLTRWEFWRCTPELHRRLFVEDVHGGTLVFRRHVWQHLAPYPDLSLAEDAAMLSRAIQCGARLAAVANDGLFMYLRHAGNSWAFACGQHLDPAGWRRVAEPPLPPADRAFYAAHSPALLGERQRPTLQPGDAQPLVSCIMPTADRRVFAAHAIRYFLRQDYPNRELIVLDDGVDPIDDLMPPDPAIRYMRLNGRRSLGAKRNLACQAARGDLIAHWDDDDWIAPWRLSYQVAAMREQQADACGLNELLYLNLTADRAWRYRYPPDSRAWVAGGTLCYTRALWTHNPFPEIDVGEDAYFLWSDQPKRIVMLDDSSFYVALIHPANTSPKSTDGEWWRPCPTHEIWRLLGDDRRSYSLLAHQLLPEVELRSMTASGAR
jgi:glycosyltransferase involved in cell wall biosynthesis